MKIIFSAIIITIITTYSSLAQINMGLNIGTNVSYYSGATSDLFYVENQRIDATKFLTPGFDISFSNKYQLNKHFNLINKIGYRFQGFELRPKYPSIIYSSTLTEHFLYLQFSVEYNLFTIEYFSLGLNVGYLPSLFLGNQISVNNTLQHNTFSHSHDGLDHLIQTGLSTSYSFDFGELVVNVDYRKKLNNNVNSRLGEKLDFIYESIGFTFGYSYNLNFN